MLNHRWLSNSGIFEQEFEARIAKMLDGKRCVSMCNTAVPLEIAIRSLGLKIVLTITGIFM